MNDINLKIVKEYVDKKVAGTLTGKSAYQIAVDNGFVGTEQEWLAEIKNYEELNNKPQINNVTLSGNKTSDDLSLQSKLTAGNNITIENNVISAEGADVSGKADKSYVDTELAKKADKTEIPTKISAFTNDVGYLTQHQDISGKADKSTTLSGYGITNAYTKSEVDAAIQNAIGNIETLLSQV